MLQLDWITARDDAMERVERKAGPEFADAACDFAMSFLRSGPATAEAITLAARAAGIVPHDDRAFGPVYMRLSRQGLIEKAGPAVRTRGHGTSGGNVWRLRG
jgi:hypothetical protein